MNLGRAVRIAYGMGTASDDATFKAMSPAQLWPAILEERDNAESWRPHCEELAILIGDRVRRMERLLTEKLAAMGAEVEQPAP